MTKIKILKISEKTHKKLKEYCNKNSLKLYQWAEMILLDKINMEKKPDGNLQNNEPS